jgi:hypothetical protein
MLSGTVTNREGITFTGWMSEREYRKAWHRKQSRIRSPPSLSVSAPFFGSPSWQATHITFFQWGLIFFEIPARPRYSSRSSFLRPAFAWGSWQLTQV